MPVELRVGLVSKVRAAKALIEPSPVSEKLLDSIFKIETERFRLIRRGN